MRGFLVRFSIATFSIMFFFGLIEILLRILGFNPQSQNLYFLLNPELDYPKVFKRDHDLFWKFKTNQVIKSGFMVEGEYRINSLGLRNGEISKTKPPGSFRIICLGNSTTFGWKVKEEDAYPQRLQALFTHSDSSIRVEVVNAGITGYSSHQGKIFFKRDILPLEPDLLVVNYGWNDLLPAKFGIADKEQKLPPQRVLSLQDFFSEFRFYQLLKSAWVKRFVKSGSAGKEAHRVSPHDFRDNLLKIARDAKEDNVGVVFLTDPVASIEAFWGKGKISRVHQVNQLYNQAILSLAEDEGLRVLDLAPLFYRRGDLYDDGKTDYIHYNAKGHQLVAETIYQYLKDNHLVVKELPPRTLKLTWLGTVLN